MRKARKPCNEPKSVLHFFSPCSCCQVGSFSLTSYFQHPPLFFFLSIFLLSTFLIENRMVFHMGNRSSDSGFCFTFPRTSDFVFLPTHPAGVRRGFSTGSSFLLQNILCSSKESILLEGEHFTINALSVKDFSIFPSSLSLRHGA